MAWQSERPRALTAYTEDVRVLLYAEMDGSPPTLDEPHPGGSDWRGRLRHASSARPRSPCPTEEYLRGTFPVRLNPGMLAIEIWEAWPTRPDLLRTVFEAAPTETRGLSLPPQLARALLHLVRRYPRIEAWMARLQTTLDQQLDPSVLDILDIEALVAEHVSLRTEVATAARSEEITRAELVVAAELLATTRFLQAAGLADLLRARREGGDTPEDVARTCVRYDRGGKMIFERGLRASFRQPDPLHVNRLSGFERDALCFARSIRSRSPTLMSDGLLAALPIPDEPPAAS